MLAALRLLAPDGLAAPLSEGDVRAVLAAGAEVKGRADGLVDFPAVLDGEPIFWCWRAGERHLEWWHPRASGYRDRRRIIPREDLLRPGDPSAP